MGLDMYLTKRTYIGNKYRKGDEQVGIKPAEDGLGSRIVRKRISSVEESVGYWRKANQIHNWFVQNVQEGVDDCRSYSVSYGQLVELRDLCKRVIEHSKLVDGKVIEDPQFAQENLPTSSGFFFGSTEYDEYYLHDLESTVEQLDALFGEEGAQDADYKYQSSW